MPLKRGKRSTGNISLSRWVLDDARLYAHFEFLPVAFLTVSSKPQQIKSAGVMPKKICHKKGPTEGQVKKNVLKRVDQMLE